VANEQVDTIHESESSPVNVHDNSSNDLAIANPEQTASNIQPAGVDITSSVILPRECGVKSTIANTIQVDIVTNTISPDDGIHSSDNHRIEDDADEVFDTAKHPIIDNEEAPDHDVKQTEKSEALPKIDKLQFVPGTLMESNLDFSENQLTNDQVPTEPLHSDSVETLNPSTDDESIGTCPPIPDQHFTWPLAYKKIDRSE
jgi:hypothetical protein